jgi:hypothetical protein
MNSVNGVITLFSITGYDQRSNENKRARYWRAQNFYSIKFWGHLEGLDLYMIMIPSDAIRP